MKRYVYITLTVAVICILGLSYWIYKQYKDASIIRDNAYSIGNDVQLGYHREINLIERLNIVNIQEYRDKCKEFSKQCLYDGNELRGEYLKKIQKSSFKDDDMDVINMVSSIEVSVKGNISKYNDKANEYNEDINKFPLVIIKVFMGNLDILL